MTTSSSFNSPKYFNRNIEIKIGQIMSKMLVKFAKLMFGLIVFNFLPNSFFDKFFDEKILVYFC